MKIFHVTAANLAIQVAVLLMSLGYASKHTLLAITSAIFGWLVATLLAYKHRQ